MTLAEAMVFALEQAVESLLEDLHQADHDDRLTYVEAARLLEEMSAPWIAEELKQQETADGR